MKDIRVSAVQFQHTAGDKNHNFEIVESFIKKAHREQARLVVFPEMCLTGYWHVRNLSRNDIEELAEPIPGGPSTQRLLTLSEKFDIIIGAGLIEQATDGQLYNAYVVAMPDGSHAVHRKLHCFISKHMTSGNSYTVFNTPFGRMGVLICWDNNLVENVRITALKGAEILLSPHQTGGTDSRSPRALGLIDPELWHNRNKNPEAIENEFRGPKGRAWLMRWLPARAHDNGLFLVFSNGVGLDDNEVRTGNAMILDPYGEIITETWAACNEMVTADLKASELVNCTGRRWMKGRRPDLYGPICESTGKEKDARTVRFSKE